ncbi:MAG: CPBP family glutamic-type intramembrane protease [Candidatus Firestonebacteria bacterium]
MKILKNLFKWQPNKETFIAFSLAVVIIVLSMIMPFFEESITIIILIRDVLMIIGGIFFPLWYIQSKKYQFKDFGLSTRKWYIYLPINIILGVLLLFIFLKDYPDAKIIFDSNVIAKIGYIMIAGVFETIVFYAFLRKIFEDAFGIIPAILLSSIAYSFHHAGFQPEFLKLIFVGVLYATVFRAVNSALLIYPFFWGVGGCFDVLIQSKVVDEILYSGIRVIILFALLIIVGFLTYRFHRRKT